VQDTGEHQPLPRQLNLPGLSDSAVDSTGAATDAESLALIMGSSKTLARSLIREFGSLGEAIATPVSRLTAVGVNRDTATRLEAMQASIVRVLRAEINKGPVLFAWPAALDYLRAAMAFADREEFRILFLDKRNQLIADEVQQVGTGDHTPVYPREVLRRALELRATAILLVHNHPSGDPTPSHANVQMTRAIIEAGKVLGIAVHDHVIVVKEGHQASKGCA
jgi:DNA repair protein RadC